MKKKIIMMAMGILLIASITFAADGDFTIEGNVGIGTTSPESQLHINNASGPANVRIESGTTRAQFMLINEKGQRWSVRNENNNYLIFSDQSSGNDPFTIEAGASDYTFFIKSSGNVGIGTNNPQSRLAIEGLPTEPPSGSVTRGIVCITYGGDLWIDINSSDGICNGS